MAIDFSTIGTIVAKALFLAVIISSITTLGIIIYNNQNTTKYQAPPPPPQAPPPPPSPPPTQTPTQTPTPTPTTQGVTPSSDCVGHWDVWSPCDAACGGGTQSRNFIVDSPAQGGGRACPSPSDPEGTQSCNTDPCPIDCVGEWGRCDDTCNQTFTISTPSSGGGITCSFSDKQSRSCGPGLDDCPANIDCVGEWVRSDGGPGVACGPECGSKTYSVTQRQSGTGSICMDGVNEILDGATAQCQPGEGNCNQCTIPDPYPSGYLQNNYDHKPEAQANPIPINILSSAENPDIPLCAPDYIKHNQDPLQIIHCSEAGTPYNLSGCNHKDCERYGYPNDFLMSLNNLRKNKLYADPGNVSIPADKIPPGNESVEIIDIDRSSESGIRVDESLNITGDYTRAGNINVQVRYHDNTVSPSVWNNGITYEQSVDSSSGTDLYSVISSPIALVNMNNPFVVTLDDISQIQEEDIFNNYRKIDGEYNFVSARPRIVKRPLKIPFEATNEDIRNLCMTACTSYPTTPIEWTSTTGLDYSSDDGKVYSGKFTDTNQNGTRDKYNLYRTENKRLHDLNDATQNPLSTENINDLFESNEKCYGIKLDISNANIFRFENNDGRTVSNDVCQLIVGENGLTNGQDEDYTFIPSLGDTSSVVYEKCDMAPGVQENDIKPPEDILYQYFGSNRLNSLANYANCQSIEANVPGACPVIHTINRENNSTYCTDRCALNNIHPQNLGVPDINDGIIRYTGPDGTICELSQDISFQGTDDSLNSKTIEYDMIGDPYSKTGLSAWEKFYYLEDGTVFDIDGFPSITIRKQDDPRVSGGRATHFKVSSDQSQVVVGTWVHLRQGRDDAAQEPDVWTWDSGVAGQGNAVSHRVTFHDTGIVSQINGTKATVNYPSNYQVMSTANEKNDALAANIPIGDIEINISNLVPLSAPETFYSLDLDYGYGGAPLPILPEDIKNQILAQISGYELNRDPAGIINSNKEDDDTMPCFANSIHMKNKLGGEFLGIDKCSNKKYVKYCERDIDLLSGPGSSPTGDYGKTECLSRYTGDSDNMEDISSHRPCMYQGADGGGEARCFDSNIVDDKIKCVNKLDEAFYSYNPWIGNIKPNTFINNIASDQSDDSIYNKYSGIRTPDKILFRNLKVQNLLDDYFGNGNQLGDTTISSDTIYRFSNIQGSVNLKDYLSSDYKYSDGGYCNNRYYTPKCYIPQSNDTEVGACGRQWTTITDSYKNDISVPCVYTGADGLPAAEGEGVCKPDETNRCKDIPDFNDHTTWGTYNTSVSTYNDKKTNWETNNSVVGMPEIGSPNNIDTDTGTDTGLSNHCDSKEYVKNCSDIINIDGSCNDKWTINNNGEAVQCYHGTDQVDPTFEAIRGETSGYISLVQQPYSRGNDIYCKGGEDDESPGDSDNNKCIGPTINYVVGDNGQNCDEVCAANGNMGCDSYGTTGEDFLRNFPICYAAPPGSTDADNEWKTFYDPPHTRLDERVVAETGGITYYETPLGTSYTDYSHACTYVVDGTQPVNYDEAYCESDGSGWTYGNDSDGSRRGPFYRDESQLLEKKRLCKCKSLPLCPTTGDPAIDQINQNIVRADGDGCNFNGAGQSYRQTRAEEHCNNKYTADMGSGVRYECMYDPSVDVYDCIRKNQCRLP